MKVDNNFEETYKIVFEALEKGNKIERLLEEMSEKLDISIILELNYLICRAIAIRSIIKIDKENMIAFMNAAAIYGRGARKGQMPRGILEEV